MLSRSATTARMSAANWKKHTTTTTSAEVRRPAKGRFSGNDAVDDILERLPSRAICAESMELPIRSRTNMQSSNQHRLEDDESNQIKLCLDSTDESNQIKLCLESPCEDADGGYIPLAGGTNSRFEFGGEFGCLDPESWSCQTLDRGKLGEFVSLDPEVCENLGKACEEDVEGGYIPLDGGTNSRFELGPCEEDAEGGYIPLDGGTESRFEFGVDPGVCENLGNESPPRQLEANRVRENLGNEPSPRLLEANRVCENLGNEPPSGGFSDSPMIGLGPLLSTDEISAPPTQKKVKRISVGTWASVSFSHICDGKTLRFVAAVRNECVRLGLDFHLLPSVSTSLKSALPTSIERAMQDLFKNIKKFSTNGKQLGLLIVILPDTRDYDEEVEKVCKDLGVAHHCLPPAAIKLGQKLSAANEIYSKFLNQVSYGKEDGDSNKMDEMGEDDISNGKEEDGDSTDSLFNSDEISSYGDSSEICDKHTREDDESKVANSAKNCFKTEDGMEKPLFGSSGKRTHADLVGVKVEPSIEMYWACVSFSYMDDMQLVTFLCDLQIELTDIGMDFSAAPIKTDQVGSVPADIRNYLFSTCDSISELFTKYGMKGERIRLLLVILPEDTCCHAEVHNVCNSLGVVYHCCLPNDARMPSAQFVEKTADQIMFKVEQEAMVPLLSVFPTIFIGAGLLPGEGSEFASMAASMDWPKASNYIGTAWCQPSCQLVISDLRRHMRSLMSKFCDATGKTPKRMIFFRHGIIDERNMDAEIEAICSYCDMFDQEKRKCIKWTYVVVMKKDDMENKQRWSKKTKKSTEVEQDTSPRRLGFEVLCDHSSVTETSMQVHYRVAYDENCLTSNDLQSMIIKLSQLRDYKEFPQISMVPPAHYACELAAALQTNIEPCQGWEG